MNILWRDPEISRYVQQQTESQTCTSRAWLRQVTRVNEGGKLKATTCSFTVSQQTIYFTHINSAYDT